MRYVIDKERRLVITTATDRVTFAEIRAHQDQLSSDPDFDPAFNQLVDATAVTELEISVEEAKQIAKRRLLSHASKRAFVASAPSVFGMGRLIGTYHEMADASEVRVFYDLPSAFAWLGLESHPR